MVQLLGEDAGLGVADLIVLAGYFVLVFIFGVVSSLQNRGSVGGYFLAGRNMNWILVGASLFASNIGSGHFIGLAGAGAASGIGMSVFEISAIFILMILGYVFVPVYMSSGIFTMPEYMKKRFGGQRIRVYLAVLALLLSIFTKVSADLYAGSIFLKLSLGWSLYTSIILLLLISALFAILGGLTAVIWTDFIQTIIMLVGAIYLMVIAFIKVGGYKGVKTQYPIAYPNVTRSGIMDPSNPSKYSKCGIPSSNAFHLIHSADDSDLPWPGVFIGLTISAIWYWCSDQVIVQRALASKNLLHAKAGCIMAGYLKFLPMWLMVVPGMISRILYTDQVGCADPDTCERVCGSRLGCTNIAYPKLVLELMPPGARGLMTAVMMSALMSSLTSIFNSSSTLFTIDIWKRLRSKASDAEMMIVGRVFVLFMVAVGIAWIPIVQSFSELFHYIQSVTSYLAPPICAVYVLAIFWDRINEQGAFWGLMAGLAIGLSRFIAESCYPRVPCGDVSTLPAIIAKVHYLHFGILLFGLVCIVTITISLLTEPIPSKHLVRLLFWNRKSKQIREDIDEPPIVITPVTREQHMYRGNSHSATYNARSGQSSVNKDRQYRTNVQETEDLQLPFYKLGLYWICGIEKQSKKLSPEIEANKAHEEEIACLKEKPLWAGIVNMNACVLCLLAAFFWGLFA